MSGDLDPELQSHVCSVCRLDGAHYVCPNGVSLENARRAVQAAFVAGNFDLALDIAQQCSLRTAMCIRCTRRTLTKVVIPPPVEFVGEARWWWHLCEECQRATHQEHRNAAERRRLEKALQQ